MRRALSLVAILPALLLVASAAGSGSTPPAVTALGGAIAVDGRPTFPIFAWAACQGDIDADLAAGVTAFMTHGQGCGSEGDFLAALGQRAYYVAPIEDGRDFTADSRLLGYVQADEPDGHGTQPEELPAEPGRFVFMTLTAHFAQDQAPLPAVAKAVYPAYAARADALGFDVYPLAQDCGHATISLASVYADQRDLVTLAGGRPTYQWIETGSQEGACGSPVTPSTVRAEAWLAVAGGARGLGWFTYAWPDGRAQSFAVDDDVAAAMARTSAELQGLAPILLAPSVRGLGSTRSDPVKVGARTYGGRTYLVAVNSWDVPVSWSRPSLPGLARQAVTVVGEHRTLRAVGGRLTDAFPPLGVHVYAWTPSS